MSSLHVIDLQPIVLQQVANLLISSIYPEQSSSEINPIFTASLVNLIIEHDLLDEQQSDVTILHRKVPSLYLVVLQYSSKECQISRIEKQQIMNGRLSSQLSITSCHLGPT